MRLIVIALTFVACSFDSGGFNGSGGAGAGGAGGAGGTGGAGGIGGTGGSAGTGGSGGTTMPDAPMPDAPVPDAAPIDAPPPGLCLSLNLRVCITSTQSGHCDNLLQPIADRSCPPGSLCSNGYCQPPNGAQQCQNRVNCGIGQACDLYVVAGQLQGYCTNDLGGGGTFASCNDDRECRAALCVTKMDGTRNCLALCMSSCPGGTCDLVTQPATIEGVSTSAIKSCFN